MTRGIQRSFDSLEKQKRQVFDAIAAWPEARLRFRPEPNAWSTVEVLDHVMKVERAFLSAVKSNLGTRRPVAFTELVGASAVVWVMRSPMRVKVPASARLVLPEVTAEASAIATAWDAERRALADFLQHLAPHQMSDGVFRHPVSGWMTIPQGLAFLSAHLRHHGYQLNRLTKASCAL